MSKTAKIVIVLTLAAIIIVAGSYFRNAVLEFYNAAFGKIEKFAQKSLGNIAKEIEKEILAPKPLNIGGVPSKVVLYKDKIIAETNIQRYNNGILPPLIENAKLNLAAKTKAEDMFLNQYFDHVSPNGKGPGDLLKNYQYDYIVAGENLILGNFKDEKDVVFHWMNSPAHRANILSNRFSEIGVAIIKGSYKGQTVWIGVQEFGLPLSECNQPNLNLKNQIDTNQAILDKLSLEIDAKKSEIDKTNKESPKYDLMVYEYNKIVKDYNSLSVETKNIILQYNSQVDSFNKCVAGSD